MKRIFTLFALIASFSLPFQTFAAPSPAFSFNGGKETTQINDPSFKGFSASMTGKSVLLAWAAVNEVVNNHYSVERSYDGTNFQEIGIALDGFENGTEKAYAFKDYTAQNTHNVTAYYRLKQTGTGNSVSYSTVLAVQLPNGGKQ